MRREHVFQAVRFSGIELFISGYSAPHFLNIAGGSKDRITVNNVGDLFYIERIVLDGKRSVNSTDTVFLPQLWREMFCGHCASCR